MVRHPQLAPSYRNMFFTNYLVAVELVAFLGQVPLLLLHEAAHTLAGRRLGLPTRLAVGRRLYYVVFLTTMDSLVSVPRRSRYLPMLAAYSPISPCSAASCWSRTSRGRGWSAGSRWRWLSRRCCVLPGRAGCTCRPTCTTW